MAHPCEECRLDAAGSSTTSVSSKILEAARKDHIECMESLGQYEKSFLSLLNAPVDAQYKDVKYECQGEDAKDISQSGVDVNQNECWNTTTLEEAVRMGRLDIVEYLLRSGADVNMSNCLVEAVNCGEVNIVKTFLQAGADVNRCEQYAGENALTLATRNGNVDIINLLIEFGADVNLPNFFNLTPLIIAIDHSHVTNARKTRRSGGWSITGNAGRIIRKQDDVKESVQMSSLTPDEYDPYMAIAKSLIQAGADVNGTDHGFKWRAFRKLERTGDIEMPSYLIGAGSHTALMSAASRGSLNMIEVVIDAGADVNMVNECHNTALMTAARKGHQNITKALIESGADVNKICKYNHTALFLSALIGNEQGVRLLLRSGAKVNFGRKHYMIVTPRIRLLLHAAGESMVPRNLKIRKDTLYHICREAIRKHLLKLDPHENLFFRIPGLGLPSLLVKYLLFDESLDENYDQNN